MRRLLFAALCVTALVGCADAPTSPVLLARDLPLQEGEPRGGMFLRQVGRGWVTADTPVVSLPTRVRRGEPLPVQVGVSAGGCVGPDTTVTTIDGRTATIVPYSVVPSPAALALISCLSIVYRDERRTTVVFTQSGTARVRVVFRGGAWNDLQVVERRVTVTP